MWDSLQPQDQRGNEILDWIFDNDLHVLNDGSDTRTSRITSNDSLSFQDLLDGIGTTLIGQTLQTKSNRK